MCLAVFFVSQSLAVTLLSMVHVSLNFFNSYCSWPETNKIFSVPLITPATFTMNHYNKAIKIVRNIFVCIFHLKDLRWSVEWITAMNSIIVLFRSLYEAFHSLHIDTSCYINSINIFSKFPFFPWWYNEISIT